jgi:hypothetical protein
MVYAIHLETNAEVAEALSTQSLYLPITLHGQYNWFGLPAL